MKLDLPTLCANIDTATPGGSPSWGTALGQGIGHKISFPGMEEFLPSLLYRQVTDLNKVKIPLGKGGHLTKYAETGVDFGIIQAALYEKVYVNDKLIEGGRYILVITKEFASQHAGRFTLKYGTNIEYNDIKINEDCLGKLPTTLGIAQDAGWFINDINVKNQDELHFTAYIVNANGPQTFPNQEARKKALQRLILPSITATVDLKLFKETIKNLIEALRTKPFLLLAGISGTGKSQKVKELAFMTCPKNELGSNETTPGNYCLIEVKPNWHDSSELLGYYSNLTKKYQVTDFLRFVCKATKNPGYPFFICLDEMNLAPVEQYFAEYLSVLETRTLVGGEVKTAELLSSESFKGYDLDAGYTDEDREVVEYIQNNGLRLPENLFVVGTVNMDDTTHQFSRKVIDRAFTIEMNGGKLADMFSDENRNSLSYRDAPVSLEVFKPEYVKAAEALDDSAIIPYADAIKKKVPVALDKINAILKDTPFRVSYRVQNELILYAVNILLTRNEENPDIDAIIKEATLVILLEKILPRVQGDDKLLGAGEDSIFKKLQGLLAEDYSHVNELAIYKEVDSKLKEMDTRLANSYFANFF